MYIGMAVVDCRMIVGYKQTLWWQHRHADEHLVKRGKCEIEILRFARLYCVQLPVVRQVDINDGLQKNGHGASYLIWHDITQMRRH